MRQRAPIAHFVLLLLLLIGLLPGCMAVEVGVSNPAPNLPRIAITPFVNLSSERSVDGRRFAEAYYTELQKIPGFQVIPVGVVDSAIHDHELNLDTPEDLLRLAQILDADGICLGAVTEYTPYYPPRLGLQISWYSPNIPDFQPGIPVLPTEKPSRSWKKRGADWSNSVRRKIPAVPCIWCKEEPLLEENIGEIKKTNLVIRAQNEPALPVPNGTELQPVEQDDWDKALREAMDIEDGTTDEESPGLFVPRFDNRDQKEADSNTPELAPLPDTVDPNHSQQPLSELLRKQNPAAVNGQVLPHDNANNRQVLPPLPEGGMVPFSAPDAITGGYFSQPYMSYTRLFDGADAKFTAALRNYLELGGDQRSGGWTGHLHRSEDFIRFCMHRSIVEMFQLHGGETKRRFVLTSQKYQ